MQPTLTGQKRKMPKLTDHRVEIWVGSEHVRRTEMIRTDELIRRATSPMASWSYRQPADLHQGSSKRTRGADLGRKPKTPNARKYEGRRLAVALTALSGLLALLVAPASPASATSVSTQGSPAAATEQAQVSQLEAEIATEGTALQQLVARSNQAQAHLAALQRSLVEGQAQLRSDRAGEAAAAAKLRAVALYEYVNGSKSLEDTLTGSGSLEAKADAAMVETEYVTAAGVNVNDAIHALSADEKQVSETQARTKALAGAATQAVSTLDADRQAAQQALDAEQSTLAQAKGNLALLLAQSQNQQSSAQQADESTLASQARAAQVAQAGASQPAPPQGASPAVDAAVGPQPAPPGLTTPPSAPAPPKVPVATPPPAPTPTAAPTTATTTVPVTTTPVTTPTLNLDQAPAPVAPSPGSYSNPLRSVQALYPERVDQGVDYSGYGPIYAIGDGVVLSVTNSGWPDGTFIAYRLTDGPAAGLTVYAAEDILPSVTIGEQVTSSTVLGTMFEGPNGIETGWASYAGTGATMAWGAGQFGGSNSTAFGYNFSQLLSSLAAPPGVLQNDPATGNLPPEWPQW